MSKLKTLAAAAALVAAPGLAVAQGCNYEVDRQTTMSCAPGTTFDATSGTCVATPTG